MNGRDTTRIAITGVGLLTPLGASAWGTFRAVLAGRTLADRCGELPDDVAGPDLVRAVGSVAVTGGAGLSGAGAAVELAERATREAAAGAGVSTADLRGMPMWVGTSKGGVAGLSIPRRSRDGNFDHISEDEASVHTLGPHGYMNAQLMARLGVEVRGHTVAACGSGLVAVHRARGAMLHGSGGERPSVAVVVSSEAALTPLFVHSYQRLGVLAPLTPGGYRERPLDEARDGFMLAQAGAAVVLRRIEPGEAVPHGAVELVDTLEASDPHDLIRPSPTLSTVEHIVRRLAMGRSIAAVHPHAPGTAEHDPRELAAITRALPDHRDPPRVYACKGAVGHPLGAAGLSALVLACLSLRAGRLPPMPWLDRPIRTPLRLSREGVTLDTPSQGHHLVLAAGFAGHTAGALIG